MINDIDIWRAANDLVRRHGDDAAIAAAHRADELLAVGDIAGCAFWVHILSAVKKLARTKPGKGKRAN